MLKIRFFVPGFSSLSSTPTLLDIIQNRLLSKFIFLQVYLSICLYVYLTICPSSSFLSTCISACLSVYLSICSSLKLYVCLLSISLSVCLTVCYLGSSTRFSTGDLNVETRTRLRAKLLISPRGSLSWGRLTGPGVDPSSLER